MALSARPEISLDDRYLRTDGRVYLTGLQALVRLPIDQSRRDRRTALKIGTFISGYPGSPLGGYDLALHQAASFLEQHDIVHVPGANEELAATAISGTQMLDDYPHSRFDGVVGLWYGKGPGVDRSGDALRHGNFAGTSRHGAVVVLSGEDHEAKSSSVPYQDDYAFQSHGMPILYPATTAEFLSLGLHAVSLSRFSGCWVALKLTAPLVDGGETVEVSPELPSVVVPDLEIDGRPFTKSTNFRFFPGENIETERRLYYERHPAVAAYARANLLDRIVVASQRDRLGIVSSGKSYTDLVQAFRDLGLDDPELHRLGVRVLRLGLLYPADAELIRAFALDLERVIVVEEKRGFLEAQVKEALNELPRPVPVRGKRDDHGAPMFPIQGGMDSDLVAERIGERLLALDPEHRGIARRLEEIRAIRSRGGHAQPMRTPNYCSGCPHNVGTKLLPGQLAWGAPGCHAFASIIAQPERHIVSMTQMGGEGLPWIGLQPFTDRPHIVQNVGDGSLFHSSYLNIRFAVAAGANMTFKILYNGYVANTGAQDMVGAKSIPELTRLLEIEGVRRTAVVTKDPRAYADAAMATNSRVHPVEEQDHILKELEQEPGVTVFIYDGICANERRRRQKRGKMPVSNRFVVINPEVCENCGHCGAVTNCMSLHTVETEFGPKTQVHTSSCNQDESCLAGDCPSFVVVETREGTGYRRPSPPELAAEVIPDPERRPSTASPYHIYMAGVGGTGVITLNALLAQAALLEGKHALAYDQTGAAQKWGPVVSSLVVSDEPTEGANKVGLGRADLYLALDLLAAAGRANLERCEPGRTAAVLNTTLLPSGEMVRDIHIPRSSDPMAEAISRHTDPMRTIAVEARRLAEALFGDYLATNVFALGVAYQSGLVPLSAQCIEAAIRLNGAQVQQNVQAFRYGRVFVADRPRLSALVDPPPSTFERERARALQDLSSRDAAAYTALLDRCAVLDEESRRLLAVRVAELIHFQSARYPVPFVDFVLDVAERERVLGQGRHDLTHHAIRNLYKLMAYKDEYEVARLHLKGELEAGMRALFEDPRRISYQLHPPVLRAIGLRHKLSLGPWIRPGLRLLRRMRWVRGTRADVFGYSAARRQERRLVPWYRELVETAIRHLDSSTYSLVVDVARLPEGIRGYEQIKMQGVQQAEARASSLLASLRNGLPEPPA